MCEEQVSGSPPLLLQWVKTEHALVMLFNNGTLQVWKKLMNSTIYLLNKWCNAVIRRANCISFTWTLASDHGLSPTFTSCFSSLTGQLLHRPHKDYPVQVVRWLVPAHLHQPRAGLVYLPPQHADGVGLHLGAQTSTAIRGPAAPTPRWCLRTPLGALPGCPTGRCLGGNLTGQHVLLGSLTVWYNFSRQCWEEPMPV